MKIRFLKQLILSLTFLSLLVAPNEAKSWSLFGSDEDDLIENANKVYDSALSASQQGNNDEAISLFSDACSKYSSIQKDYPDYETKLVAEKINSCKLQIQILKDRIINADSLGNKSATISSSYEDGVVVKKTGSRTEVSTEEKRPAVASSHNTSYSPNNPLANANTETRIQLIDNMLKNGSATDAIFHIDEVIAIEGDKTDLSIRCLYVKALISVGNKALANKELEKLRTLAPNNPSVLSLAAALAIVNGDQMEAMLNLDLLIEAYPKYAEARVNYAYLLLMMDPSTYRDAAINSYTVAIKLGAKRDLNLERNLNIIIK